jgi:hypothetical protein
MTLEETKTMLIMIAAAYPNAKYAKESVQIWHDVFKAIPAQQAITAVKEHISTNVWEPKIAELLIAVEKKTLPRSLTMTPSEALLEKDGKLILVSEAREFANKAVPFANDQYNSPEDLALALRIHQARWDREFKERFEYLQNLAKSKVHLGMDPKTAILGVKRTEIGPSKQEAKKLLSGFTSTQNSSLQSVRK